MRYAWQPSHRAVAPVAGATAARFATLATAAAQFETILPSSMNVQVPPLHPTQPPDIRARFPAGRRGQGRPTAVTSRDGASFDFGGPGVRFWNAGDEPCEIVEVVSPGGFEDYFREVAAARGDLARFSEITHRHGLEMDLTSLPKLCQRFGLTFPPL